MFPVLFPKGIPIIKRIFDLVVSVPVLIVSLPVMAVIAAWLYLTDGPPVLFIQMRPGYRERLFPVLKFRSMRTDRTAEGDPRHDEQRLTRFGRFLRLSSLDELPELINVLWGEMSIVGPRPLLKQYLDRYSPEQARRHHVLPGITGWAQVHGRNILEWEEKFKLDVWYVDHWSFGLDLKILVMTVWKVLKREGISQPGHATAPEFMGSHTKAEQ